MPSEKTVKTIQIPPEIQTKGKNKRPPKREPNESVYIQFAGAEYNIAAIKDNIRNAWTEETGKTASAIRDLRIYVKPEENVAYYVVNDEFVKEGRKVDL